MATKFVSKNSNYMVVLRSGIEGNRAIGTQAKSGLYVRFEDGMVNVKEESIITQLRDHPNFGSDFLEIKPEESDPFASTRVDLEPQHTTSDIKYGHVMNRKGAPAKVKLTPELKRVIKAEALKMVPGLLQENPKMLKEVILSLAKDMEKKDTVKEETSKEDPKEVDKKGDEEKKG